MAEAPKPVSAIIRRLWSETPKLTGVVLEVPEALSRDYVQPGQYVVIHTAAGKRVFLAITSAPEVHGPEAGEPARKTAALELLLAEQAMKDLDPVEGGTLLVDPPAGRGFQVELAKGRDVVMFAVGSAIGAMRPVVEVIRRARSDFGRVTLYVGAHTPADLPYASSYDAWTRDRIDVVRAASKPWVQDLVLADPVPLTEATAFICGGKPMMEGVTSVLLGAGLPADRIRRNF